MRTSFGPEIVDPRRTGYSDSSMCFLRSVCCGLWISGSPAWHAAAGDGIDRRNAKRETIIVAPTASARLSQSGGLSPCLLALNLECRRPCLSPLYPSCPARVNQVFLHNQVPDPEQASQLGFENPFYPSGPSQIRGEGKPDDGADSTGKAADQDLLRGVVAEVDATHSHGSCRDECQDREKEALEEGERRVGVGRVGHMAEEEEEGQGNGEEADELGVRRGHSIALAMHFCGVSAVVRAKMSRRV